MRNEWNFTLLSALIDSLITWQTITGTVVNKSILVVRLMLFVVAALLTMARPPLWKATNFMYNPHLCTVCETVE